MKYSESIRAAIKDSLSDLPDLVVLGQGVWSPFYVGNTMDGLAEEFGKSRVIDTPVSENGSTGMALGIATLGFPALVIHPRMDFMIPAMDAIVNAAAKWRYSLNSADPLPLTIRAIINRGGEQGAQHSQALHSWFAHIPGLRVVMPSSPSDAYRLLRQSIYSPDPVIFIEDRWSYELTQHFEMAEFLNPLDCEIPMVLQEGSQITVVGIGHTTNQCADAIRQLGKSRSVELIDLRIVQPLRIEAILNSVKKTGRLLVVDGAWKNSGLAGEIICQVVELLDGPLLCNPSRICLPDSPAPTSRELESAYYFTSEDIAFRINEMCSK